MSLRRPSPPDPTSGSGSVVVVQHPAQALTSSDRSASREVLAVRTDDPVRLVQIIDSLQVTLAQPAPQAYHQESKAVQEFRHRIHSLSASQCGKLVQLQADLIP